MAPLIVALVLALFAVILVASSVRVVRQARVGIVERWGKYRASLPPGLHLILPMLDRITAVVDMRETVQAFAPQPVITQDNVTIGIDTVVYYQVTDPFRATYEVANVLIAMEQLAITTLRNVVGSMTLEGTLTSRDEINTQLRIVLDEATEKWGVRVTRVELKSIDPPRSIQEAMEQQMRADRNKRAAILTAEGVKQSQILTAEGEKQSAVLRAEGARTAAILKAEGEAKAIETVFNAIHEGAPDQALLQYQYLQTLPQLAQGDANKIWIIPSEFTSAVSSITEQLTGAKPKRVKGATSMEEIDERARKDAEEAARAAAAASEEAESATSISGGTPAPREIAPGTPAPAPPPPGV